MKVSELKFEVFSVAKASNTLAGAYLPDGSSITVLDRTLGLESGARDVETGYLDADGKMWIASGSFDIRRRGDLTVEQAIKLIKKNANICIHPRKKT